MAVFAKYLWLLVLMRLPHPEEIDLDYDPLARICYERAKRWVIWHVTVPRDAILGPRFAVSTSQAFELNQSVGGALPLTPTAPLFPSGRHQVLPICFSCYPDLTFRRGWHGRHHSIRGPDARSNKNPGIPERIRRRTQDALDEGPWFICFKDHRFMMVSLCTLSLLCRTPSYTNRRNHDSGPDPPRYIWVTDRNGRVREKYPPPQRPHGRAR